MSALRAISLERSTLVEMPIHIEMDEAAASALYMLTSNALLFENLGPAEEEIARTLMELIEPHINLPA